MEFIRILSCGRVSTKATTSPASWNGTGCSRKPSAMLNIAAVAPMPKPRATAQMRLARRCFQSIRKPKRMSFSRVFTQHLDYNWLGSRVGVGFLRFFGDAAVEEVNAAIGEVGVALIVGDHADGGAVAMEVAKKLHDRLAIFGVQVTGGLVGHQDEWIAYKRAGHGDALLLTAGELRGIVTQTMSHADTFEGVLNFLFALGGAGA